MHTALLPIHDISTQLALVPLANTMLPTTNDQLKAMEDQTGIQMVHHQSRSHGQNYLKIYFPSGRHCDFIVLPH